jgi:RHS repeat-associated protein
MLPAAEERIPALTSGEEIFSLAAGVALAALETYQGARAAQGKKPHQGIFSRNRTIASGAMWAKWSGTHQDRKCSWSKTVVGSALDANGNTLSDPSGKSYTWDFENRLTQAVVPGTGGGTTTFKYDPFGRRVQKSGPLGTTNYLYDGPNDLIEEIDNSGNVLAKYTQTTNIDEPLSELRSGATSYYEQDGIDAVTSLTNPTGAVANSYTFDSFGKLTASTGTLTNPFQYTGRELDGETGLYYYRARYYDSNTGRFISGDPLEFGGGVNFYPYALNSPVNLRDPRGKSAGAIAVPVSEGIGTLVCFGSGVCETVIVVGGVVVGVAATGYLIWELVKPCDKTNTTRCAPCIPPAGTIAYRLDVVPPSRVHKPYPGTHWHLYRMNQNPNNCQCFWQDLDQDGDGPTPPGTVPITPAAGGGPQ